MNPDNTFDLLVDKIDGLNPDGQEDHVESLIAGNEAAAAEYARLQFMIAGIREAGLNEQVSAIRSEFRPGLIGNREPAKVVTMNFRSTVLRVAAAVLLIVLSATTYKFIAVTDTRVYHTYYSSFDLNTSRARSQADNIDIAYKNKDWQKVIALANTSAPTNKEIFLRGVAQLESSQFEQAVASFNQIISQVGANAPIYFLDESEYYLAMAYLASNQAGPALKLLNKIEADAEHVYNSRVKKMKLEIKVLEIKN